MHPDTAMLVAYRDGELGERPARKVGGHLETCGECARALAEMKAAWELLAAEAGPRPPEGPAPDGCARLQAAIEGWEKPQPEDARDLLVAQPLRPQPHALHLPRTQQRP